MLCKNCGKDNPNRSPFCPNCGSKMEYETSTSGRPISGIEQARMQQKVNLEKTQEAGQSMNQQLNANSQMQYSQQMGQSMNQQVNANPQMQYSQQMGQSMNQQVNANPQMQYGQQKKKTNVVPIIIGLVIGFFVVVAIIVAIIVSAAKGMYKAAANAQNKYVSESESEEYESIDEGVGDYSEIAKIDLTSTEKSTLDGLATDYGKINWTESYTLEDLPGMVISVAPYEESGCTMLLVGVTNLGTSACTYNIKGDLLNSDNEVVGSALIDGTALAVGNTEIFNVSADSAESIIENIKWTSSYYDVASDMEIGVWAADYSVAGTSDKLTVNIDMKNTGTKNQVTGTIGIVILDGYGNVMAVERSYQSDEILAGCQQNIKIDCYIDESNITNVKGLAMFANPLCD